MKRLGEILIVLVALAAAGGGAGCRTPTPTRMPAVAIAIRPVGDRPPSAEEMRETLQALHPALLRVGASMAERRELADFVMTVTYTPATASSGSRVRVIGIEPTARFREATEDGDTPEAKEWRRRVREIEGWNGGEGRSDA